MEPRYDISQLFNLAFDFIPLRYKNIPIDEKARKGKEVKDTGKKKDAAKEKKEADSKTPEKEEVPVNFPAANKFKEEAAKGKATWMGTTIVFPFSLSGGDYKHYIKGAELDTLKMADFDMPAATMVEFSRAKNITRTQVLGGKGTVKELYSFDDWKIKIKGLCITDSNRGMAKTAIEQKKELLKFAQICGSIKVNGELFLEKDIHYLVVDDLNFKLLEGQPDVIPFEMTCESDEPIELIL